MVLGSRGVRKLVGSPLCLGWREQRGSQWQSSEGILSTGDVMSIWGRV